MNSTILFPSATARSPSCDTNACSTPRPRTRQLKRNVSTLYRSAQRLVDQNTDESIVAESIGHANHQTA